MLMSIGLISCLGHWLSQNIDRCRVWCVTGLHFTYPQDKQRAQDVKDKLVAAHDVEAHGGATRQHEVCG